MWRTPTKLIINMQHGLLSVRLIDRATIATNRCVVSTALISNYYSPYQFKIVERILPLRAGLQVLLEFADWWRLNRYLIARLR